MINSELSWATSSLGTSIALYEVINKMTQPILLMGGIHGDEPEGIALAEATLDWLKTRKEHLQSWIIIPCVNPDGVKAGTRVNGRGVDLNRNYPSKSWSRDYSSPRYYPGPSPGSEPEIQAIVSLIQLRKPQLIVHCHSWEPCIVYTGEPGKKDAERLALSSGYPLKSSIGYPTPGSLSQFGWFDHHIPVICIEEKEGELLPWLRFEKGMRMIFEDRSPRQRPS